MNLSNSKSIILYRFHEKPDIAFESIRILRHFNPDTEIHAFYGGEEEGYADAAELLKDSVSSISMFEGEKEAKWKWRHTDLMLKDWHRKVGKNLEFDFLFSYEYDIVTFAPLDSFYPDIDDHTLALAASGPFTEALEHRWTWTSHEDYRPDFLRFCEYLKSEYGIKRQSYACLGPGPLLPRSFLDEWIKTDDIELVHDELAYPAYAEALGYKQVAHSMHPGFGLTHEETKFFNCHKNRNVTPVMIKEELAAPGGVRSFHPLKEKLTLEEVLEALNALS